MAKSHFGQSDILTNRMTLYTVTFVAPILFRPDISTAVLDSRNFEVSKSQEFPDKYECITLKH